MREIKFRVWDSEDAEMFFVDPANSVHRYDYGLGALDPNTLPVMQYTGLSDKNGVDMFDGDVVRVHDSVMQVLWDASEAAFLLEHIKHRSYFRRIGEEMDDIEVIGNIHQHPELLEGGKE